MARQVGWTETAWADVEQSAEYIGKDSPSYAAALVTEARDAARSLAEMAERGRIVPDLGDPRIRELLVGNYRLIYRIAPGACQVLAFIHGARDLAALWSREERG